jgi:transposase-like protein
MPVSAASLTGAALGERSAERTNQRNGYRTRLWHTGVGTVPVAMSYSQNLVMACRLRRRRIGLGGR